MKILFTKDSPGNGRRGEVKEVSDGFAKNFLIARGFAQPVTPQLLAKLEKEQREQAQKKQRELARLEVLKQDLQKRVFSLKVKIGDKGQVFGGVHEKDIIRAVEDKLGVSLEKNQIKIKQPIRTPGEHRVDVVLSAGMEAKVKISLEPEN